jgi:hypothetical protein
VYGIFWFNDEKITEVKKFLTGFHPSDLICKPPSSNFYVVPNDVETTEILIFDINA